MRYFVILSGKLHGFLSGILHSLVLEDSRESLVMFVV